MCDRVIPLLHVEKKMALCGGGVSRRKGGQKGVRRSGVDGGILCLSKAEKKSACLGEPVVCVWRELWQQKPSAGRIDHRSNAGGDVGE